MVWEQLSIDRPHLVYIILGGFTSLFMLCSSVIKERLYIGEATVATLCGIIFGPHAANLIDPGTWGNTDQITLEFSRIVLVVQCFAVGVELPKAYMERHWRSVTFLLLPVMTFGWLITSLFIYGLIPNLDWLDSLVVAACVTATDPVLASSVVGKGKFAKRVPRHLRDLLSAESGCNDGMAFPFVYLALYLIKYRPNANEVSFHWFCLTILYECIFGAFYGFVVGYVARRAVRYAHERDIIDRESFLVFYFVLALFCAGSGSILGLDDLLVGFACGVGFSNDGWFTEKTEESHVSNVIDLLINLAFFVYFGTIIPWAQFNADVLGLSAWRLVVIGLLVLFFRRIPVMLALKPLIPDVKTWREALFAGHFGPIGVGAIFVAILARAELETDTTTPLAVLPEPGFPHRTIIELIWPIVTFLVVCSILVHGSSVAVFTLGKHINTFTLTMSYTTQNDASWLDRLPKIQSRSKSSMSQHRGEGVDDYDDEKAEMPGQNIPHDFLRRQREHDESRRGSVSRFRRPRMHSLGSGGGGPVSDSAFGHQPGRRDSSRANASDSDTLALASEETSPQDSMSREERPQSSRRTTDEDAHEDLQQTASRGEVYEEGGDTVYEDKDGNVLEVEHEDSKLNTQEREAHERDESRRLTITESQRQSARNQEGSKHDGTADEDIDESTGRMSRIRTQLKRMASTTGQSSPKAGIEGKNDKVAARAYRCGNSVVIEDDDGEVIKQYQVDKPKGASPAKSRARVQRMGSYLGFGQRSGELSQAGGRDDDPTDDATGRHSGDSRVQDSNVRFTLSAGGRRMNVTEFMDELQKMDPKARARFVEQSNAPEAVKSEARADARDQLAAEKPIVHLTPSSPAGTDDEGTTAEVQQVGSNDNRSAGADGLRLVDDKNLDVPLHNIPKTKRSNKAGKAPAQSRRRQTSDRSRREPEIDSDDDGTPRIPPKSRHSAHRTPTPPPSQSATEPETAAERRRREDAFGIKREPDSDSEAEDADDAVNTPSKSTRDTSQSAASKGVEENHSAENAGEEHARYANTDIITKPAGIRFADQVHDRRRDDEMP